MRNGVIGARVSSGLVARRRVVWTLVEAEGQGVKKGSSSCLSSGRVVVCRVIPDIDGF